MKIVNRSLLCSALLAPACLLSTTSGSAQMLSLQNASFEEPLLAPIDFTDPEVLNAVSNITSASQAQFIIGQLITIDRFTGPGTDGGFPSDPPVVVPPLTNPQAGWIQTGPQFTPGFGIPASNSSGIFSNEPIPALQVPAIPNTSGDGVNFDQLAFILADPFANGGDGPNDRDFVSIYQESSDVFAAGQNYRFALDIGQAVTFAAGDEAPLRIAIGVLNDSFDTDDSKIFQEIAGHDVFASPLFQPERDLDNSGVGTLRNFFVDLPADQIDPAFLGQNIAIQVRVDVSPDLEDEDLFNVGGAFNVDNARLSGGILGDLDGDGVLAQDDVTAFVLALNDPNGYAANYDDLAPDFVGDFNTDGVLTRGDVDGFVALFQGLGFDTTAVPEPTSLALLGLGGVAFARRRRQA